MRLQCPLADNASTSPLTACLESPLSRHPKLCPSHNDTKTADTDDAHVLTLRCHEIALLPEEVPPVSEFARGLASLRQGVVWGFLALRLLAIVFSGVAITLTDAAIDLVEDEPPPSRWTDMHRLLGSAGWGAASLLTGHLNYWKSPDGGRSSTSPPACTLSVSMKRGRRGRHHASADAATRDAHRTPLHERAERVPQEPHPVLYGAQLRDGLAQRRHLGVRPAQASPSGSRAAAAGSHISCAGQLLRCSPNLDSFVFGGELVHAFASDQLVQLLGVRNAASASVLGMVARLLVYAFTPVPWALLPIEAAQGLTVGLFSKTTFSLATGATPDWHLQQVLSTIHHGLGASFGALCRRCLIPLLQMDGIFVFYAAVAVLTFYAQLAFGYIRAKKDAGLYLGVISTLNAVWYT
ncbi:hypothetical protein HPB48_007444 [Haemaphysalis longicornis]|uniref:Major facilitator superfamily associated domain-containing protein n=1 Tax=Haemaphysalis longicornis TaxID=44386 RepID=A0A9J6GEL1_HAELO|nr:hypothetical protein HPB48_007444 [Haemaphysalis longicornis]